MKKTEMEGYILKNYYKLQSPSFFKFQYVFLDSEDYESFIRNVLSFKCDSDTLGAIGGGIAEEFYKDTGFNNDELLKKYLDERLYGIVKESK